MTRITPYFVSVDFYFAFRQRQNTHAGTVHTRGGHIITTYETTLNIFLVAFLRRFTVNFGF